LPITGTGNETRDFTYVGDIINGLLAMAYYKEAVGESINLASGREIRIGNLAEWINKITGNTSGITYTKRRNWDKKTRLLASIKNVKKILHYKPEMDFIDGLKSTHEWFINNLDNIKNSTDFLDS